jgi:O-methyltransferase involved in polyketide biosynthesis
MPADRGPEGEAMPTGVHDSAFIVNAFRARYPQVSADPHAALWQCERHEHWATRYAQQVGRSEVLVHALRHRFFLERLQAFLATTPDAALINIGAGFTSYPFLIRPGVPCCEVDMAFTVAFKQQKLAEFNAQGLLPARPITFLPLDDLNDPAQLSGLLARLWTWLEGRTSFVLLEGVLFYLHLSTIENLLAGLASIQGEGGIVATTSFRPEECQKAMFQRLVSYCTTDYQQAHFSPTSLPNRFYHQQQGYALLEHRNCFDLQRTFSPQEYLGAAEDVLEEDLYLLQRTRACAVQLTPDSLAEVLDQHVEVQRVGW